MRNASRRPPASLGVTLVEVLVVMAIVSVLLAISTPAILAARAAAVDTRSLVNAKQSANSILASAYARQGMLPIARVGGPLVFGNHPTISLRMPDGSDLSFSWFAHTTGWNYVLVAGGADVDETWYSPSNTARSAGSLTQSDYILTQAAMASPEFWRVGGRQTPEELRPVRIDEFAHPSAKGLLIERWAMVEQRRPRGNSATTPRPVAFADGHSDLRRLADARPGVPNSMQGGYVSPIATTRDGSQGRDY